MNVEKEKVRTILDFELHLWIKAYPRQKKLLEDFTNKLKYEIEYEAVNQSRAF